MSNYRRIKSDTIHQRPRDQRCHVSGATRTQRDRQTDRQTDDRITVRRSDRPVPLAGPWDVFRSPLDDNRHAVTVYTLLTFYYSLLPTPLPHTDTLDHVNRGQTLHNGRQTCISSTLRFMRLRREKFNLKSPQTTF